MNLEPQHPGADIDDLLDKRNRARERGDWPEADRIRDELTARGILLHDTAEGTLWTLRH